MAFEVFERNWVARNGDSPWRQGGPMLKVVKHSGRAAFQINRAAFQALGEPAAVLPMHDPERNLLGFKAAETDHVGSHRINGNKTGTSYYVTASIFARYLGLEPNSEVLSMRLEGDVLCAELAGGAPGRAKGEEQA